MVLIFLKTFMCPKNFKVQCPPSLQHRPHIYIIFAVPKNVSIVVPTFVSAFQCPLFQKHCPHNMLYPLHVPKIAQ